MLIRRAKPDEKKELMPWLVEFIEIAMPMVKPDVVHLEQMLTDHIHNHVVLVAEVEGKLKGVIIGSYVPHYLNPKMTVLQELAWWVPVEFRNEGIGKPLLLAFSSLRKTDATVMSLRPETQGLHDKYLEQGFELYEYTYVRSNKGK
jgi:hypothetical protein